MFKKYKKTKIHRFKEFDEARVYIENPEKDRELTYKAIDYMIIHKEFYYLLRQLFNHIKNKNLDSKFWEYALSNMSSCPSRREELEIYLHILKHEDKNYREPLVKYLTGCSCKLKKFLLQLLKEKEPRIRKEAVSILKHCYQKNIKKQLIKHLQTEKDKQVIKEILDYLYIYGTLEEIEQAESLLTERGIIR